MNKTTAGEERVGKQRMPDYSGRDKGDAQQIPGTRSLGHRQQRKSKMEDQQVLIVYI